jgi:hypothetical protein
VTRFSLPVRGALAAATLSILVLGATACNKGTAPAAKVNGDEISSQHLFEGAALYNAIETPATGATPAKGKVPTSSLTQYLNTLIQMTVLNQQVEKAKVQVTDADTTAAQKSLADHFNGANGTRKWATLPSWFQDQLTQLVAQHTAFSRKLAAGDDGTAAALAAYKANQPSFTNYCLDAIIAPKKADAAAAVAQLRAGADFATVAKATAVKSKFAAYGTKGDGNLGCGQLQSLAQKYTFLPLLSQATIVDLTASADGDVIGPAAVQNGVAYAVLRLRSHTVLPFSSVKAQILSQLGSPGEGKFAILFNRSLTNADVFVNPRFGTWGKNAQGTPSVVAPKGADLSGAVTSTTLAAAVPAAN